MNLRRAVCGMACGAVHYPFGRSRRTLQERFGLPTLAELPILSRISDLSDEDAGADIAAIAELAERVHRAVGKSRAEKPALPDVDLRPEALLVRWPDGYEAELAYHALRVACPCAVCVDETSGRRILDPNQVPADIRLEGYDPLGNYAVVFTWSDGHTTGIYSWEYLRRLAEQGIAPAPRARVS